MTTAIRYSSIKFYLGQELKFTIIDSHYIGPIDRMKMIKSMQYTLYFTTYEVLETLHYFKIDIYYN